MCWLLFWRALLSLLALTLHCWLPWLTAVIFVEYISLNIFFITFHKILIRKHLGMRGISVLGKILRRKDLRVKYGGIRS